MKEKIWQIVIGFSCFIIAFLIDKMTDIAVVYKFIIYLVPYGILAYDSIMEAFEGIKEKEYFNEQLLMVIASFGAMIIGFLPNTDPEFIEGVFVMLFFQVGELFELIADSKSSKSIEKLMEIHSDSANLVVNDEIKVVNPKKVKVGNILLVKVGEKVPLDSVIVEGESYFNTSMITGEAKKRFYQVGDMVYEGFINTQSVIKVKVLKLSTESSANRIINLVKNAMETKTPNEKFITKFAKIYTPIVLSLAFLMVIISLIFSLDTIVWVKRALTFLVISCPCALVISVPLAYFCGIGGASRYGILFKGSNCLEQITKIDTLVFDKTGTVTEGIFDVSAIHEEKLSKEELLHLVYHAEEHSNHPIAESLRNAYLKNKNKCKCQIRDITEIAGMGVKAVVNGKNVYVGNDKLMQKEHIEYKNCHINGTIIHVATKDEYLGHIVISDTIKKDSYELMNYLRNKHIKTIMLTGDKEKEAADVSKKLGISTYYANLMPEEKLRKIDELSSNVAFIGDGINDVPALAKSMVGITFGGLGSDASIEVSDVILINDDLKGLSKAFDIARKTLKIVGENIWFSIVVKIFVLILSFLGITNMWMAVFADVGVTIIVILNSFRTLK